MNDARVMESWEQALEDWLDGTGISKKSATKNHNKPRNKQKAKIAKASRKVNRQRKGGK